MALGTTNDPKPRVRLVGQNGNAFLIIGLCSRAWRKAGLPAERWKEIMKEMTSGDYDNLLRVAMTHFEVL